MSLTEEFTFSKEGEIVGKDTLFQKLFLSLVIILVAAISFGLGRLTGGERGGIKLEFDASISNSQFPISNGAQPAQALQGLKTTSSNVIKAGEVVGSSKGTKYHYPHCSSAKRILEANRIVFASASAAEASGYTLAANCQPK